VRVGLDEGIPTIFRTIGWGKLYDEPRLGSRLLTLEFLMTFERVEKNRKSFVKFHLFRKSFGCDLSHFSELLDFSKSYLHESSAMRNFTKVEFSDAILENLLGLGLVIFTTLVKGSCIGGCRSHSFPWWNCVMLLLLTLNVCFYGKKDQVYPCSRHCQLF
jgi:hypothetical protein